MIFYFIITLLVMLLFAGALCIGYVCKIKGYEYICSAHPENCLCNKKRELSKAA